MVHFHWLLIINTLLSASAVCTAVRLGLCQVPRAALMCVPAAARDGQLDLSCWTDPSVPGSCR